ncbi:MAG TPA: DUF447 domain-containing protein [Methylophilaceae bacterium]|jgi:hypothetical protein
MIYETIVISTDAENNPHIAPFGILEQEGLLVIAPFRPSASLDNLLNKRAAVINLTDDVRVFAGALTGRRAWTVSKAEKINGYVLDGALAHKELELVSVREDATRPELKFRVVHEVNHRAFKGFNRAQAAVIELSILVSRLHMLEMTKIDAELTYLEIAIEKTAGEHERQAWSWLIEKIENHKALMSGTNQA